MEISHGTIEVLLDTINAVNDAKLKSEDIQGLNVFVQWHLSRIFGIFEEGYYMLQDISLGIVHKKGFICISKWRKVYMGLKHYDKERKRREKQF